MTKQQKNKPGSQGNKPGSQGKKSQENKGAAPQGSGGGSGVNIPGSEKTDPGRKIDFLVIHCSASNLAKHDNIATIDAWHKQRGFKGVGYHFFIQRDGTLEFGRPLDDDPVMEKNEIGAHTLGINASAIGVCLSGIDSNDFTAAQFETLETLVKTLLSKGIDFKIAGHNYFTDLKTCPNFDWRAWVADKFPDQLPPKK